MILPSWLPMLATAATPFDSEEHLFEVKWDGIRALAAGTGPPWRLWGRKAADYRDRYPELAGLGRLPAGTVVDGELVRLVDGRADLPALLCRHQLRHPDRIGHASRQAPVAYLLFDLLAYHGRPLLAEPLAQRRVLLAEVVARLQDPRLVCPAGVVGPGRDFFARVVALGHEGVMAKHLAGRYEPGKRSSAWQKIKPRHELPCVIIGYGRAGPELRSLLVATLHQGVLRYVGQLTSGLRTCQQADLLRRLEALRRPRPVVACPKKALWVEPALYCRVQFFGWTAHGHLRHAVWAGRIDTPTADAASNAGVPDRPGKQSIAACAETPAGHPGRPHRATLPFP